MAKVTESGCVDSCYLGRLWKESSIAGAGNVTYDYKEGWERLENGKFKKRSLPPLEGGPFTLAPEYLVGWRDLTGQEKCDKITAFDLAMKTVGNSKAN